MNEKKQLSIANLFTANRDSGGRGNQSGGRSNQSSGNIGGRSNQSKGHTSGEDKSVIIDREKKKSIWSLFTQVDASAREVKKRSEDGDDVDDGADAADGESLPADVFFTPRNALRGRQEREKRRDNRGNSHAGSCGGSQGDHPPTPTRAKPDLFRNMHENLDIQKEIENITSSFKRKNNILLGDKTDDSVLSSILSRKRTKMNVEGSHLASCFTPSAGRSSASYNAYKEFFAKGASNQNGKDVKEAINKKTFLDDLEENKMRYQIKDDNVMMRMKGVREAGEANQANSPNGTNEEGKKTHTCMLKKKNVCVPVNKINENNHQNVVRMRKAHQILLKKDNFDIFHHLGDDLFRYIISNVKNKNLLLLNRRFRDIVRCLRLKLIYDVTLKNTIPPESIIKTVYTSDKLQVLDLSGCSHLSSHHFHLFCNSNHIKFDKTLKILCLNGCSKITDSSLKVLLHRFKHLSIVDLRNCYKISHDGIYPLKFKTSLVKLYLGNTTSSNVSNYHSDDTLRVLFSSLPPSSEESTTQRTATYGADMNVQIDTPLKLLSCFEITNAKQLSDISYLYIISKNLKVLSLRGCNIDDTASIFFKCLTNLIALNVADTKVSNGVIKTVCAHAPNMMILDISKTIDVQNDTILTVARSLKRLRKIKVSSLQNVDNFSVREFLKHCRDLIAIDFSSCWKVNNSFCHVNGLDVASGPKLTDVGVYQCSVDRRACEGALTEVGCSSVRVHIYNELKIFETSIYADVDALEKGE
ncbi:hypothetical protein C922_04151 [Plasmodium inui San Antonio 1]|uniref:Leucine-rich repeat protein n=1 Tax=Plasmodium inui San Antonio 1 TaxID=1237626 RepID=W7AJB0_9APIC|nr:hypothetical protein C922_04151 [Plasmodium inui San Antonio 1]EUD65411.1 hypothetical protein C922_04151 [Plasmodium inui San Antonio 1]